MTDERREHDRMAVRTIVRMQFETIGDFLQSYAQNISTGGMQLAVAQELAAGDKIALEFKLKSDFPLIQGTAIVVWCRQNRDHFLIGVEFDSLDEQSSNTIREAINVRNQQDQGGDVSSTGTPEIDASDLLAPPEEDELQSIEAFSTPEISELSADEIAAPETDNSDFGDLEIDSLELPSEPEEEKPEPAGAENIDVETFDIELDDDIEESGEEVIEETEYSNDPGLLFEDTSLDETGAEDSVQLDFGTDFDQHEPEENITIDQVKSQGKQSDSNKKKIGMIVAGIVLVLLVAGGAMMMSGQDAVENSTVSDSGQDPQPAALPAIEPQRAITVPVTDAVPVSDSVVDKVEIEPIPTDKPEEKPSVTPTVKPVEKPKPVKKQVPRAESNNSATVSKVVKLSSGKGKVWMSIRGDAPWSGNFKYFALSNPPRAVIDLLGVEMASNAGASKAASHPVVDKVRVGRHPDKWRIVLDLSTNSPFELVADGATLLVREK